MRDPDLYGWFHEGDATPLLERALRTCARDHGGSVTAAPTVKVIELQTGVRETRPVSIFVVEDDSDGWWEE